MSAFFMENPLQQGRFFNNGVLHCYARTYSRNPFGAGAVFQFNNPRQFIFDYGSQSLWSRGGFSIDRTIE